MEGHAGQEEEQGGRLLSPEQVAVKLGVSASTLRRLVLGGEIPSGHRISRRRVVWREAEVERWISER